MLFVLNFCKCLKEYFVCVLLLCMYCNDKDVEENCILYEIKWTLKIYGYFCCFFKSLKIILSLEERILRKRNKLQNNKLLVSSSTVILNPI